MISDSLLFYIIALMNTRRLQIKAARGNSAPRRLIPQRGLKYHGLGQLAKGPWKHDRSARGGRQQHIPHGA